MLNNLKLHCHNVEAVANKFTAFGWNSCVVDGHNYHDLVNAFDCCATDKVLSFLSSQFHSHVGKAYCNYCKDCERISITIYSARKIISNFKHGKFNL